MVKVVYVNGNVEVDGEERSERVEHKVVDKVVVVGQDNDEDIVVANEVVENLDMIKQKRLKSLLA